MPKTHNTQKQRRRQLMERITPDYLFTRTCIFTGSPGGQKLDERTVKYIQDAYKLYFETWVQSEAEKFILDLKDKSI